MNKILIALFATILMSFLGTAHAQASIDNFFISSFKADYVLSQLEDGRSQLTVTETIVADFPNFPQNKGIVRAIPERYNTFSLEFQLLGVTRNGQPENIYDRTIESGYHVLALGTDEYLLGRQTYEFRYQVENVITEYDSYQEIFWNVNGDQSRQQMLNVEATVRLEPTLQTAFTDSTCFQGKLGSREPCTISVNDSGSQATVQATRTLGAGENMSFVLKLPPNSFTLPPKTMSHFVPYLLLILVTAALAVTAYVLVRYGRDHPGRGLTPTQYIPQKDIPLVTAAKVKGVYKKVMPAQLIDLAVRGAVELIDHAAEGKKSEFTVRYVRDAQLHPKEISFLTKLFSGQPHVGASFRFTKKQDTEQQKVAKAMASFLMQMSKPTTDKSYRQQPKKLLWGLVAFPASIGGSYMTFIFYDFAPIVSAAVLIVSFFTFILGLVTINRHPLTPAGRELKDYLVGLERYIQLAETDRLAFLQSVEGAQRKESVVRLYERVLPYAVLFGHEKSWVKVLQLHYQEDSETPLWLQGAAIANLPRTISSFSTSSSSYGFTPGSGSGGGGSGFSGGGGSGGGGGGGGVGGR